MDGAAAVGVDGVGADPECCAMVRGLAARGRAWSGFEFATGERTGFGVEIEPCSTSDLGNGVSRDAGAIADDRTAEPDRDHLAIAMKSVHVRLVCRAFPIDHCLAQRQHPSAVVLRHEVPDAAFKQLVFVVSEKLAQREVGFEDAAVDRGQRHTHQRRFERALKAALALLERSFGTLVGRMTG